MPHIQMKHSRLGHCLLRLHHQLLRMETVGFQHQTPRLSQERALALSQTLGLEAGSKSDPLWTSPKFICDHSNPAAIGRGCG